MRYFKGNTSGRNKRIEKLHEKFRKHQRRWILRRFAKHFLKGKK